MITSDEVVHPKYKTQMCRHFMRGHCLRGASCGFAHGVHDLRLPKPPPEFTVETIRGKEWGSRSPSSMTDELRKSMEIAESDDYVLVSLDDIPAEERF